MHYKGKEVKELGQNHSDLQGFGEQIRMELSKRIPHGKDVKALDVGTGFAITTEFLARTLSNGSRIWTLDPSGGVLKHAKDHLRAKGLDSRIEFMHGSIDRVDLPDGFFDILVSAMVLHHVKDLNQAMNEMARVVGGQGRILIVDYNPSAANKLKFKAEHRERDFFPAKDVAIALKSLGFSVESADFGLWYLVEGKR